MNRGQEKVLSHILMVVAPLLVLLMITVAWFINSRTVGLSEMSFAAQDYGPGATLYPVKELGTRDYRKATLSYDSITWGEKLTPEQSDITIENMLPGQCAYYLLVSDETFTPRLMNIRLTDADGKELADDAIPTDLLPQCLGLYLIPTTVDLTAQPPTSADVSISLDRIDNDGKLENTLFRGGAKAATFTIPEADIGKAYILVIFCDPVYSQNGPSPTAPPSSGNPGGNGVHEGMLPGAISFSLAFDKVEEP